MNIKIFLNGHPVAQKRHRHCATRDGIRTFNPNYEQKREYQQRLKTVIATEGPETPLKSPIAITLGFYIPMPKSWSKKRKEQAFGKPCSSRPDIDNYIKFILDIMNGIVFQDDAQVWFLEAAKTYSDNPCVEIEVRELDDL